MRVYEEYASAAEKRDAQRGAKRGKPTGKSNGYLFVVNENGRNSEGDLDAIVSVTEYEAGNTDPRGMLGSSGVGVIYLRTNCRRIGAKYLPPKWKRRYDYCRTPE